MRRRLVRVVASQRSPRGPGRVWLCPVLRVDPDEVTLLWLGVTMMRVCRASGYVIDYGGWTDLRSPEVTSL